MISWDVTFYSRLQSFSASEECWSLTVFFAAGFLPGHLCQLGCSGVQVLSIPMVWAVVQEVGCVRLVAVVCCSAAFGHGDVLHS